MHISLKKNKIDDLNHIQGNNYYINYLIEIKEVFKETQTHYIFLDSNYSERYINSVLNSYNSIEELEQAFKKDGLLILINKISGDVKIQRDLAGLKTCYYHNRENEFILDTNVHNLAHKFSKKLNKKHVYQLLYFDFLWDGQTIYKDIEQLKAGQKLTLNNHLKIVNSLIEQPNIEEKENTLSENQNIRTLRTEIAKAHKPYLNNKNTVYLSGGIDSVAMLIALDDLTPKNTIENHSFKVKGTTQDETNYAKSIANHLNIDLKIIERDLRKDLNTEVFEEKIFEMNNPYPGMWIFGNQINNQSFNTYYAGQDTRLHTPALNILDQLAFNMFSLGKKGFTPLLKALDVLLTPFRFVFDFILRTKNIHDKKFLGLRRALYIFNTRAYLNLVYFKLDKAYLRTLNLPLDYFETIKENYNLDVSKAKNQRALYNTLVSKKWVEQYVNDMRYMVDMVKTQGGKLAMPFYDMDLAKFSATIPFKLANKKIAGKGQFDETKVKINKFVLREALADKIDQKTYLRSKAVSRTGHLIFTQALDQILKDILTEDKESNSSFVKAFKLEPFLKRFLENKTEWRMTDDKYLLKVYYAACLCVYSKKVSK